MERAPSTRCDHEALLDVAPTLAMSEQTTRAFATACWHWFFLVQPAPLPERLIQADPAAHVREVIGRRMATPARMLWGAHGVVHTCFDPFQEWQRVMPFLDGAEAHR